MHITSTRAPRVALAVLAAAIAAVALAACGSSSSSSSSSSAAASGAGGRGSSELTGYQSCLKSHGVTLPNFRGGRRPGAPGGSGHGGTPPYGGGFGGGFFGARGADTARGKKFQAAAKACASDLPRGAHFGRGPAGAGGHFDAAMLANFSACVKRHGYTLPKPRTSGYGPVFPRSIESNKTFEKAARACAEDLRPAGG